MGSGGEIGLIQQRQYQIPYHWLPQRSPTGTFSAGSFMSSALEYFTYCDYVARQVKQAKARTLLDVGCGDARFADILSGVTNTTYTGVDTDRRAVAFGKLMAPKVRLIAGPVEQVNEEFDVVTLMEVLEHIPDEHINSFLAHVARRIRAGGKVIVCVPSNNRPVRPKHFRHYSVPTLKTTMLQFGIQIEAIHFVYKIGWWTTLARRMVDNRIFSLKASVITTGIWNCHRVLGYIWRANPTLPILSQ